MSKLIQIARAKYSKASEVVETAWRTYNLVVEMFYDHQAERAAVDAAYREASNAENAKTAAWDELNQAYKLDEMPCTCRPNSTLLCPHCQAVNKANEVEF